MSLIEFLTKNYLCIRIFEEERIRCLFVPERLICFYIFKDANAKLEYYKKGSPKPVKSEAVQKRRNALIEMIDKELRENGLD